MKLFAFLIEPAGYTLSIIDKVYRPLGIEWCFIKGASEASHKKVESLASMPLLTRIMRIYAKLRAYDKFIVNSYVERNCVLVIVLNLLIFRKPMAIESDTLLRLPSGAFRRFAKRVILGFLFRRHCIYGCPGGFYGHVSLFTYYGMPKERVFVLPMMVDNERFSRKNKRLSDGKFRFGCVSRLSPEKQIPKVISAFRQIDCGKSELELVVVGEGSCRNDCEKAAEGDPRVVFKGRLYDEKLIEAYHSFDCVVLYSAFEQWGLVINEALAAGVPVIVSDEVGCRRDLVEGASPTGIVVSYRMVSDLVQAMSTFVRDVNLVSQFRRNAGDRMRCWGYDLYRAQLRKYIVA